MEIEPPTDMRLKERRQREPLETPSVPWLVELLSQRARRQPDKLAYRFLEDGESKAIEWSNAALYRRAGAIASLLRLHARPGTRVLLAYDPGLEYIAAFLGCLWAGVIAVPTQPPRRKRTTALLQAILASSGAEIALTTGSVEASIAPQLAGAADLAALRWLATDTLPADKEPVPPDLPVSQNAPAFLQYSSGSTGDPKGIVVSHGNLLSNLTAIRRGFEIAGDAMGVTWLPMYHDMGLIGGILEPLFAGAPTTILSPVAFVQSPIRWLEAISRFGGNISGGPTFAYQLCVEKITEAQRTALDLSRWRLAFCGAEPVREEVLNRFAETFAPCGFRAEAFYPCYGLAESTLMVSGGRGPARPTVMHVQTEPLRRNRVVQVNGRAEPNQTVVACGYPLADHKVFVVHPHTRRPCPLGRVGEIWTAGPSVAQGYWNLPEQTEQTFAGYLHETGDGPYLRTGDLGFLHDGQLYITGRLKDLVIIRGENHYSQDIEQSVMRCLTNVRANACAAFSVDVENEERLVVVLELERGSNPDMDRAAAEIRAELSEVHGLAPFTIVAVKSHSIPRTTSGKIRRRACRQAFEQGRLSVIAQWTAQRSAWNQPASGNDLAKRRNGTPVTPGRHDLRSNMTGRETILRWLTDRLTRRLELAPDAMDPAEPLALLGVDSLTALQISGDLASRLGFDVAPDIVLQYPTLEALSQHLGNRCQELGIEIQLGADEEMRGKPAGRVRNTQSRDEQIRNLLLQQETVEAAEIFEHREASGVTSLLVFFTARSRQEASLIALRNLLKQGLADCPDTLTLVPVPTLPLTEAGEVDREKLLAVIDTPTRTPLESQLEEAWRKIFPKPSIGIYQNLFALGGGGLERIKIAVVATEFGFALTPKLLEAHPSIAELSELLQRRVQTNGAPALTEAELGATGRASIIIESLGVYLPPKAVSTDEVLQGCEREVTFPLEFVTGIQSRRMAGEDEFSIDLACKATQECLALSRHAPSEIDLLICCNISRQDGPDRMSFEPGTAVQLKARFGLFNAVVFDINNACAGMFTGLKIAEAYLATGAIRCALIVSGEYITHLTRTAQKEIEGFKDSRLACLTLGDAGAAVIVESSADGNVGFRDLDLYTVGRYSDLCIGKATDREHGGAIMYSQPSKLAAVAVKHSIPHCAAMLARNLWSRDTADHVILHQTSESSIDTAVQAMNLLVNKTMRANTLKNIAHRGNTATTSQFVAVWDGILDGQIQSGQRVVFPISASGQTVGTALYTFDDLPDRLRGAKSNGAAAPKIPASARSLSPQKVQQPDPAQRIRVESIGTLPAGAAGASKNSMELAAEAARCCLARSRYAPDDIDLLIFAGVYRSEFLSEPAIGAILAGELGMNADVEPLAEHKTLAFDLANSSLGFLNACDVARQMILGKACRNVMVVASEIENNATIWPAQLRGVKETASAVILEEGQPGSTGFGPALFKYYPQHLSAFASEARLAGGKPYLELKRDPRLEELYIECIADAYQGFLASHWTEAAPPSLILPPQISPTFQEKLAAVIGSDQRIVNIAEIGADLFTSSLIYTLEGAQRLELAAKNDVGLIIEVSPGIQVGCVAYQF